MLEAQLKTSQSRAIPRKSPLKINTSSRYGLKCGWPATPLPSCGKSDAGIANGDIVLNRCCAVHKHDLVISTAYQLGIIESIERVQDIHVRKVHIRYHNSSEKSSSVTFRSVQNFMVIHRASETNISSEMYEAARKSRRLWFFGGWECNFIVILLMTINLINSQEHKPRRKDV